MSLDATNVRLTRVGRVVVNHDGSVDVSGFDGENCSCRDVCVLAMVHAMQVLSRELMADIEIPGGSGKVAEASTMAEVARMERERRGRAK
jgi:hypothetical protein